MRKRETTALDIEIGKQSASSKAAPALAEKLGVAFQHVQK
jgi:hypothetical protein